MPVPQKPPTPYEYVRAKLVELVVGTVNGGIPVTQSEFTAAFLSTAAEGAVLQGLPSDKFVELAAQFYQDAETVIMAVSQKKGPRL